MDNTYNKLIATGIKLFGEFGFNAVSIRDLVACSGANLSAVSYHFGGKTELYKAVVEHLVTEVKQQLQELDAEQFVQLELAAMELRLPEIILAFQQLFQSPNGISRINIFTRETTSPDLNLAHHSCMEMVEQVNQVFHKILSAYYTKRNEPTDKIKFVISVLISMLKNIPLQQHLHILNADDHQDIFARLLKLILYSKL